MTVACYGPAPITNQNAYDIAKILSNHRQIFVCCSFIRITLEFLSNSAAFCFIPGILKFSLFVGKPKHHLVGCLLGSSLGYLILIRMGALRMET